MITEGMKPVHWLDLHRADTMADIAGRAGLRKRFPGLDEAIGRAVGQMADHHHGEAPYRVFPDIRAIVPEGLSIAIGWTVHIVAHGPALPEEIRMPVIPDEHNPRPGKLIKADDAPYQFPNMVAAERAAEQGIEAMHKALKGV